MKKIIAVLVLSLNLSPVFGMEPQYLGNSDPSGPYERYVKINGLLGKFSEIYYLNYTYIFIDKVRDFSTEISGNCFNFYPDKRNATDLEKRLGRKPSTLHLAIRNEYEKNYWVFDLGLNGHAVDVNDQVGRCQPLPQEIKTAANFLTSQVVEDDKQFFIELYLVRNLDIERVDKFVSEFCSLRTQHQPDSRALPKIQDFVPNLKPFYRFQMKIP